MREAPSKQRGLSRELVSVDPDTALSPTVTKELVSPLQPSLAMKRMWLGKSVGLRGAHLTLIAQMALVGYKKQMRSVKRLGLRGAVLTLFLMGYEKWVG
jgi:hypothetical protein